MVKVVAIAATNGILWTGKLEDAREPMKNLTGGGRRRSKTLAKGKADLSSLELPVRKTDDGVRVRSYELYRASKHAKGKQPLAEKRPK
jgi:hypothetical protein